jgi:ribosomal protein S18 acetylase RimI-like enzyme
VRYEALTEAMIDTHLEGLIELDGVIVTDKWEEAQFRLVLPGKFMYSRIALSSEGLPMGFAVASQKGEAVHVHRLAVGRPFQRAGVGRSLVLAVVEAAGRDRIGAMTLKVGLENEAARRFYERLGFVVVDSTAASLTMYAATGLLREQCMKKEDEF